MTGFSQSRSLSFLGGAIATATSPLRSSFSEVSCQSPVTPRRSRRPSRQDGLLSPPSHGLSINTERSQYTSFSSSRCPTTPGAFAVASPRKNPGIYSAQHEDILSSSTTLVSPNHFVPLTPSFNVASSSGKLGTFSAINIILGKTVGVGIYSIPSSIFTSVGSVGASLTLWILGSLISFCGLAVYLDLGTAIPRSGGERVYLERIFKKPHMLATCMFMSYVVLLGFSTPNCIVLGEYVMYALEIPANRWNVRVVAVAVITLLCFIHARYQKLGLRIINILGVGKMLILAIVILSGLAGILMGVGSSSSPNLYSRRLHPEVYALSTARRNFGNLWEGSSTQPHDYATALLKILYCFRGYSTANQVLSQVRDPIPTLKRAAPIALFLVSASYVLANIAYFAVVEREDFRSSGVLIAGHFFRNIFGESVGENILPLFIIISAFGNIAATSFAQARVNMELGRDGLLPFSSLFKGKAGARDAGGANGEDDASPGLWIHWAVSVAVIVLPPPGEIYNFLVDIGGYPVSVMSVAISLGLLYLQLSPSEKWRGHEGYEARKFYTVVFAASNILLLVLPWVKPKGGEGKGERFVWYAYPSTSLAILGAGVLYWVWWAKIAPKLAGTPTRTSWVNGIRKSSGEEVVPMMRFHEGSDDEDEDSGDGEREIRKRAPCGCPAHQDRGREGSLSVR